MITDAATPRVGLRVTRSVVSDLGRFEARRFLRTPLPSISLAAGLWMMWSAFGTTAPVWRRDAVFLAWAMLPLGALAFLWFNHSQIRERQLAEVLDALPTNRTKRYRGRQYGMVAPLGLAITLAAVGLSYLALGNAIGSIPWWEVVAGPLMVAAIGLSGAALGRVLPHPIVAPIAVATLGFLQIVASPNAVLTSGQPTLAVEWLAPWVPPPSFEPVVIWDRQMVLGHDLFLLGATVGFLALPFWSRKKIRLPLLIGVLAAGSIVIVNSATMARSSGVLLVGPLIAEQRCETRLGVNYCAIDEFAEWIPRWQQTVEGVAAIIPIEIDWVVQRSRFFFSEEAWSERLDGVVSYNEFEWDRPGAIPTNALALALNASQAGVGLPTRPQTRSYTEQEVASILSTNPERPELEAELRSNRSLKSCSSTGQARGVVALWAAAASLERGSQAIERGISENSDNFYPIATGYVPGALIAVVDAELALHLLDLPRNEVLQVIEKRWEQVLDPTTTSSELGSWLGIQPNPIPEDYFPTAPCS